MEQQWRFGLSRFEEGGRAGRRPFGHMGEFVGRDTRSLLLLALATAACGAAPISDVRGTHASSAPQPHTSSPIMEGLRVSPGGSGTAWPAVSPAPSSAVPARSVCQRQVSLRELPSPSAQSGSLLVKISVENRGSVACKVRALINYALFLPRVAPIAFTSQGGGQFALAGRNQVDVLAPGQTVVLEVAGSTNDANGNLCPASTSLQVWILAGESRPIPVSFHETLCRNLHGSGTIYS